MRQVFGFGAGGHAKVVIDALRAVGGIEVVGLLDPSHQSGRLVMGVPVVGDDSVVDQLVARGVSRAFIGVGSVGETSIRKRLYELACRKNLEVISIVHPTAVVAPSVSYGAGLLVLAGAIVNAASTLGVNVLVNTGAIVEHDCMIGDHVHVATGARVGGAVTIGSGTHVGIGASIRQGIVIGRDAVIGAGAAVVDDVGDHAVVYGVPARPAPGSSRH
jgi:UDP-perosamine 4-acetyltransferase